MAGAFEIDFYLQQLDPEKIFELTHLALNSIVSVDALESIPVLKRKCARLGIAANFDYRETSHENEYENSNSRPYGHGQYEVERVLDHDTVRHLYLTKWKGYAVEFSTWEPIDHFSSESDCVYNFRGMERRLSRENLVAYKKLILLGCLLDELISPANSDPYVLLKLYRKSVSNYTPEDLVKLKKKLKVRSTSFQKCLMENEEKLRINYSRKLEKTMTDFRINDTFNSIEKLQEVLKNRRKFLKSLKFWEAKINRTISRDGEGVPIEIENNCDFDLPTEDFTYITRCKAGPGVIISESPSRYCSCKTKCVPETPSCCPNKNDTELSYDRNGRLKNFQKPTIFECNSKCKCPPNCPNRVIQKGRKFKLGIFKTDDGREWGVKALETIPAGRFIEEYVGEVVTIQEAERRSSFGENPLNKTYLFDLECQIGVDCDYVVDGEKYGNISRFINHSCSPNLEVYMFWVDNPDMKMPRIALFSIKRIAKGEELTFDYRMSDPLDLVDPLQLNDSDVTTARVPCKCKSSNCRKYLF